MKSNFAYLLLFLCLLTIASKSHAESICTDALQKEVMSTDFVFTNWQETYKAYEKYSACDDGDVAEGFSDQIVRLLVDHWDKLNDLNEISHNHKDFKSFVLFHIDETMSPNDRDKLINFSAHKCPLIDKNICADINHKATYLKENSEKSK